MNLDFSQSRALNVKTPDGKDLILPLKRMPLKEMVRSRKAYEALQKKQESGEIEDDEYILKFLESQIQNCKREDFANFEIWELNQIVEAIVEIRQGRSETEKKIPSSLSTG